MGLGGGGFCILRILPMFACLLFRKTFSHIGVARAIWSLVAYVGICRHMLACSRVCEDHLEYDGICEHMRLYELAMHLDARIS